MINVRSLTLATFPYRRFALEVDVGAAFETHVFVTHGTKNVIASRYLFDGNMAMATGFATLTYDFLRFQRIAVHSACFSSGTTGSEMAISMYSTKYVITSRTPNSTGIIIIVIITIVIVRSVTDIVIVIAIGGGNKLIAMSTLNQGWIL